MPSLKEVQGKLPPQATRFGPIHPIPAAPGASGHLTPSTAYVSIFYTSDFKSTLLAIVLRMPIMSRS